MYKATQNFDKLVKDQKYTQEELLETYHESTITSLVSAGVLEKQEEIKTKK